MHVLDHTEKLEELCGPPKANSSEFPVFNIRSSGQTSSYEQIQDYEKIQRYEQIQGYEKIQHCDVNLAHLVGKAQVKNVANTASTIVLSKRI